MITDTDRADYFNEIMKTAKRFRLASLIHEMNRLTEKIRASKTPGVATE